MVLAEMVHAGLIESSAVVGTIVDLEMAGWQFGGQENNRLTKKSHSLFYF